MTEELLTPPEMAANYDQKVTRISNIASQILEKANGNLKNVFDNLPKADWCIASSIAMAMELTKQDPQDAGIIRLNKMLAYKKDRSEQMIHARQHYVLGLYDKDNKLTKVIDPSFTQFDMSRPSQVLSIEDLQREYSDDPKLIVDPVPVDDEEVLKYIQRNKKAVELCKKAFEKQAA